MSAVRLALCFWGGMFVALDPFRALDNGDLYWQRWLGEYAFAWHRLPTALGNETFTAAGAPYVPQEWFISFVVAAAMRYHLLVPLAMLIAVVPIAILVSVYFRSRERASPEAIGAVLLFAGVALVASFGIRAQVLGWGCFAAFLVALDRRDRWAYVAVPIVAIWANLHASVLLAPAYLALRLAGRVIGDGPLAAAKSRDVAILALTLPAILCTPLGWHLPVYAASLALSPIRHYIQEWQPVGWRDGEFLFGGLPLALLVAAGALRTSRRDWREIVPVAALFVAMLSAVRNVPLFAIAAAPLASQGVDALFPSFARTVGRRVAEMERFALISIGVAIAVSTLLLAQLQRVTPPRTPFAAISSLGTAAQPSRLLCENFNACSAALDYPQVKVFMDGRADPYPLDIWKSYISIIRVEPLWRRSLDRYRVSAVLATRGSRLATAIAKQPGWKRSFQDRAFVVFRDE
ncbi:MAG TPA: hypothetical protein VMT95_05295 [Candidatus Binatia bacterium]|nr:hypothetical protein [Candidatus Binatia bacterium]